MAEFIRPAARAHWFDKEDDMEWGMCESDDASLDSPRSIGVRVVCTNSWGTSDPFDEDPVSPHPGDAEIPHPLPNESGLTPATAGEALRFWLAGGWDEC